jgi:hypothetical protein
MYFYFIKNVFICVILFGAISYSHQQCFIKYWNKQLFYNENTFHSWWRFFCSQFPQILRLGSTGSFLSPRSTYRLRYCLSRFSCIDAWFTKHVPLLHTYFHALYYNPVAHSPTYSHISLKKLKFFPMALYINTFIIYTYIKVILCINPIFRHIHNAPVAVLSVF